MADFKDQIKKHIEYLDGILDLSDIAAREGLKRPGNKVGDWISPHDEGRTPALSIYIDKNLHRWRFKDHRRDTPDAYGDAITFLQYIGRCNTPYDAMQYLSEMYSRPFVPERDNQPPRERTQAEWLTDEALKNPEPAVEYLVGRGVPEATVRKAVTLKSIGYSEWHSTTAAPSTVGYQGPAVCSIVRDLVTGLPVAIDKRFIDAELNGGVKTQTQGEKSGYPWCMDRRALDKAHTVYVVESAINALCVEACEMFGTAALAVRGTGNVPNIDWRILIGKRVILAFDADKPDPSHGNARAGAVAAWKAYEALTALNISAQMVDVASWYDDDVNDIADIAKKFDIEELRDRLKTLEEWAIPGLPGGATPNGYRIEGKQRVFLPAHDWSIYWRYRTKPDFTRIVAEEKTDKESGEVTTTFEDVAGFRVASLSRVTIASATSTMSGEADAMPNTVFAVTAQTARHGDRLQRRVLDDDRLHNMDQWGKLGPIYHQKKFSRLLNILERSADCGAREAINFVGLAWRDGQLVVNEGPDCYFTEPDKQCPYHNLTFPSGRREDAAQVIQAYQETYGGNAVSMALVWALGGHLKALLGFWPHMVMQADKGSGKSTQIKRLERTLGFTMFSGQSLQTEFRLITSVSHTSHPVGWEELSARRVDVIEKAVAILQESYQHTVTRRGSDMTEYLLCAPVLLAGEDVPVRSLTGKVVRCSLQAKRQGKLPPETLPRFPVREWLDYLSTLRRERVGEVLTESQAWLREVFRGTDSDAGAKRMLSNYAAVLTAWRLLCEFSGLSNRTGNFMQDLRAEMNAHVKESAGDREPFVWILEIIATEIEAGEFRLPWKIEAIRTEDGFDGGAEACLLIRPRDVIAHLSTAMRLREAWNGMPVKTHRVFAKQLENSGIVVKSGLDKVIGGKRAPHMYALSLSKMAEYGIYLSISDDTDADLLRNGIAANDSVGGA